MSLYAVVAQSETMLVSSVTFRRPDDHARKFPTPLIGPPSFSYGPSNASCRQGATTCCSCEQVGGGTHDGTQRSTNDASVLVTKWMVSKDVLVLWILIFSNGMGHLIPRHAHRNLAGSAQTHHSHQEWP